MKIATNHWGWTLPGIGNWLRYAWAWPVHIWGVECGGTDFDCRGRLYARRVKIGPVCFSAGCYYAALDALEGKTK